MLVGAVSTLSSGTAFFITAAPTRRIRRGRGADPSEGGSWTVARSSAISLSGSASTPGIRRDIILA